MAEQDMIDAVQAALDHHGIDDTIVEVGQFEPRGTAGLGMAGALAGGELGGAFGDVGQLAGFGLGAVAGSAGASTMQGLPHQMLVGASESMVYGWKMASMGRRREPRDLVFRAERDRLDVHVHARVNVRVLELVDRETGTTIELEGHRLPITHSRELIAYVAGDAATAAADAQAAAAGESLESGA